MRIKVYQIDRAKDEKRVCFESLSIAQQNGGVDPSIYRTVFYGDVEAKSLEDVFNICNTNIPGTYQGHSLSVSDLVEVLDHEASVERGCYYCEPMGFAKVVFDTSQCSEMIGDRVLYITPHHTPVEIRIGNDLKSMQRAVGGLIEIVYPFDDDAILVCNDEGKLNGMEGNRRLKDDVIAGPFFIVRDDGEGGTADLTDEQVQKYAQRFAEPEVILPEEVQDHLGYVFLSM